ARPVSGPARGVHQDALADQDVIAGVQHGFVDFFVVDKSAVDAADIDKLVFTTSLSEFSMPARNLRVMKADLIGAVAPDGEHRLGQIKLLSFIGAFEDDQARHDAPRSEFPRTKFQEPRIKLQEPSSKSQVVSFWNLVLGIWFLVIR